MKHKLLLIKGGLWVFFMIATLTISYAQVRQVSGSVTSKEDGIGLPGVNVTVKGSSTGTVTDINGKYTISVNGPEDVLVFSFVGYATQEIVVGNRSVIDPVLATDVKTLSELVVTGYAVQEKKDITGSVAILKSEELVAVPAATVENQLQGRLAGVNVTNSGQPGSGSQVRIRGFGSFQNNNPLYVVDGIQTFDISTLNPNDIESITVLKDAGAASIYGSRAANGVIVVTTKRGVKGKTKVTYNTFYGSQSPGKGFTNLLNTQEMADLQWQVYENGTTNTANHEQYGTWTRGGAGPRIPDYIVPSGAMEGDPGTDPSLYRFDLLAGDFNQIVRANKQGTNWFKEMTRNAPIINHDLTLSGGGDNSRFMIGLNYFEQQGILLETFSKRYSLRANSDFNLFGDRVRIGENLQLTYRENRGIQNLAEGNAISMAYRIQPIVPVRDIMGNYAGTRAATTGNGQNPVANLERISNNTAFDLRLLGNVYMEADILKNLTFRSSVGGTFINGYNTTFIYQTWENSENRATNSFSEGAFYGGEWNWTNMFTFKETFDKHAVTAVVGYEALKTGIGRSVNGVRGDYFSLDPNFWTLSNGATIINTTSGFNTPITGVSYFGRGDYAFDNKYLLSFTLRRDGNSGFREQFGTFPSVTAGWRVSEESFMKGISAVSDLKIRGGYGTMGNAQALSPVNQFFLFGGGIANAYYDIAGTNNSSAQGFRATRVGNPLARWETSVNTNIGFDMSLFNDKLEFVIDWYKKENKDLLFNPELPGTAGAADRPFVNIGEIKNSGIDAQMIFRQKFSNDLRFESNFTFTTFNNKVVSVADGVDEFFDGGTNRIAGGFLGINRVGHPISSFFGYQVQGIFQSDEEVSSAADQDGAAPGRFRFVDTNGDGVINAEDRTIIGNPIPDFTAGLNLSLSYKNWDLSTFLFGSYGNDIYNFTKWWTDFWPSFQGAKSKNALYNSWSPTNTNGTTPIAENVSNFSTNTQSTSYFIEDGSYLRVRQIQLGYTLPQSAVSRLKLDRVRVYVQAVNPFTITGYSGLDPELGGVDTAFGIDFGNYPVVRQYLVGLNVGF